MTDNQIILTAFLNGVPVRRLAKNWNLTVKQVENIIRKTKVTPNANP